jgi:hypothetical protein
MAKAKRPLIDKNVVKFINNNFDKKDRKKDDSLHFEWFANTMHVWHCSSVFFNADTKIGKKMALGHSEGCDAFFIAVNNHERIYSLNDNTQDVVEYLKTNGRSITFHFIQTKRQNYIEWLNYLNLFEIPLKIWKGLEFDKSHKFLKDIQDFIDIITNEDDAILKKLEHKIEITFYTICDSSYITDQEQKNWKANIESKITELSEWFSKDKIKTQIRGSEFLNDIYEKLNSNEYELTINKNNVIRVDSEKYLIGYITAKELLNGISTTIDGERTLYLDVFKNNIRLYLGNETTVNKGIEKTLKHEPEKFHLYNNGLTITTKSIEDNSKNFIIKPVNIVNGCQTANSIYNVSCSEPNFPESNVKIPVRIIVAQEAEFEDITIRTNTQNGLDTKDLISINSIQKDIEYEFSQKLFLGKQFYYKRQKSNEDISDDVDYIIQIDDILRAVFSTLMLIPNKVSGYFDKTTAKYIDQVFDENFIKLYTLLTVLYKSVEEYVENNKPSHNRLKFHICYLVYKVANRDEDLLVVESFLRDKDKEEEEYPDEKISEIKSLVNTIYSNIYQSIKDETVFNNVVKYVTNKIDTNYSILLDTSTKEKEKILYTAVEKLPRIRVTPIFENFKDIFIEDYSSILNNNAPN